MLRALAGSHRGSAVYIFLFVVILFTLNAQVSWSSRKFLTGLIIGTLLARTGQQGPSYSSPPSYPLQPQQPLFIIIPSGKSHKLEAPTYHKPYSPPPIDYSGLRRRSLHSAIHGRKNNKQGKLNRNGLLRKFRANSKNNNSFQRLRDTMAEPLNLVAEHKVSVRQMQQPTFHTPSDERRKSLSTTLSNTDE